MTKQQIQDAFMDRLFELEQQLHVDGQFIQLNILELKDKPYRSGEYNTWVSSNMAKILEVLKSLADMGFTSDNCNIGDESAMIRVLTNNQILFIRANVDDSARNTVKDKRLTVGSNNDLYREWVQWPFEEVYEFITQQATPPMTRTWVPFTEGKEKDG